MATNVIMPALELAQETGKLLRWIKAPGATVRKGEPIAEIETDKVTIELEAPASGVLSAVTAQEGDVVPVGHTIAQIAAPNEAASPLSPLGRGQGEGPGAFRRGHDAVHPPSTASTDPVTYPAASDAR
jgi:pyruvate dehydrogenase E2 component (dihydrolipoamide acetyltransferase)